jgi:hypothetical protein
MGFAWYREGVQGNKIRKCTKRINVHPKAVHQKPSKDGLAGSVDLTKIPFAEKCEIFIQ